MLLFKKKTQLTQNTKIDKIVKSFDYVSTEHFRGYKKGALSSHYENNQDNVDLLFNKYEKLNNMKTRLNVINDKTKYVDVWIDGLNVGKIYDSYDYYQDICNGNVKNVHFEKSVSNIVGTDGIHAVNVLKIFYQLSE